MTYKAEVIGGALKARAMAGAIESRANEMAGQGYSLISTSITGTGKAILVFGSGAQPEAAEIAPAPEAEAPAPEAKE
jgi:hypothetical protein